MVAFTLLPRLNPTFRGRIRLTSPRYAKRSFQGPLDVLSASWSISDTPYGLVEADDQEANTKRTLRSPGVNHSVGSVVCSGLFARWCRALARHSLSLTDRYVRTALARQSHSFTFRYVRTARGTAKPSPH